MGYKAGMTHVVRDLDRQGSSMCLALPALLPPYSLCRDAQARDRRGRYNRRNATLDRRRRRWLRRDSPWSPHPHHRLGIPPLR